MRFGICGYGNLGKAMERVIKQNHGEVVGIFTRRNNVESALSSPVFAFDQAKEFATKIDVMMMCGGSQEDLLWQSPKMCEYFNIIDTFDTHAKIETHRQNLERVAKASGHVAIYSCGWDPGLFSMLRGLSTSIFNSKPHTFWGKGVSQGHSEALRNIRGIADAIQFTIPNSEILRKTKADPTFSPEQSDLHERHCFICLDGTRPRDEVEQEIRQTENYFKGQKVFVTTCSQEKINTLKQKMAHQGIVIAGDDNSSLNFSVKMENNPEFTAKIMFAYSNSVKKLDSGAYNVLDIPIKSLENHKNFEKLL